jgi:hypothetical protein
MCDRRCRFWGRGIAREAHQENCLPALGIRNTESAAQFSRACRGETATARRVACRGAKPLISLPLKLAVPDRSFEVSRG